MDLQVTGSISPDATGIYVEGGTHNGQTYYRRDWDWYIYWDGSDYWIIAQELDGEAFWYNDSLIGSYDPDNEGSGIAYVGEDSDPGLPPLDPSKAPPFLIDRDPIRRPPHEPVIDPVYRESHDQTAPRADWIPGIEQPVRAPARPDPGCWAAIVEPSLWIIPDLDSWFQPASQPTLAAPIGQGAGGVYVCDPSEWPIETITLDKWFAAPSQPILPIPRPWHDALFFIPEPSLWPAPETVTLDEWYQPATQPVLPLDRIPPGEGLLVPPAGLITPGTWDWQQPTSQPIRRAPLDPGLFIQTILVIPFLRYYGEMRGLYRIFNEPEYRFYWSHLTPPEEGWSWRSTSSELPHTPPDTFGDGYWYFSATWFNGVLESGFLPVGPNGETYLRLDLSGGVQVGSPPAGPMDWRLDPQAGGIVRIIGFVWQAGDDQADQWAIAYSTDGSTPPADSPDVTIDMTVGGLQVVQYDLPGQGHGTTVKVRLQTRRNDGTDESPSWVYSEDSTVKQLTVDAIGPDAPLDGHRWAGPLPEN